MSADAVASCESMACCWLSTTAWAWATLACAAATAEFDPEPAPAPDPPLAGAGALAPDPVPAGGPTVETVCGAVDPDEADVVALSRTAGVTVSAVVAALCVTCDVEPALLDDIDDVDAAEDELVVPASCAAVSAASVCCALATSACAAWSCWFSEVMSSCASVCPAATCWPSWARTEATFPDSAKLTVARFTEETVPTEVTVWVTDPRVTLASRYDGPDELVIAMATPPPMATAATAATPTMMIRLRRPRRPVTASPTRTAGCAAESPAAEAGCRAARRRCRADGDAGGGDGSGRIGRAERDDALADRKRCCCPTPRRRVHSAGVDGHGVGDRTGSSVPDYGHRRSGNRGHLAGRSREIAEAAAAESARRRPAREGSGWRAARAGCSGTIRSAEAGVTRAVDRLGDRDGRGGEARDPGWRAR